MQYQNVVSESNNKKIAVIGVLVVALFAIVYLIWPNQNIKNFPSKGDTVIAFGDSLVAGVGTSPDKNFVSLLQKSIGINIENKGKPGETTAEGLLAVDDSIGDSPKVVMVLLGGNDALRKVPIDETFNNLRKIIDKIQSKGAVVVLLGIRGGIIDGGYSGRFKDLAKQTGSLYVSDVLSGIFGHPDLMFDAVHPNDKGYAKIADRIEPVLKRALGLK